MVGPLVEAVEVPEQEIRGYKEELGLSKLA
jgi:hypothetical protein